MEYKKFQLETNPDSRWVFGLIRTDHWDQFRRGSFGNSKRRAIRLQSLCQHLFHMWYQSQGYKSDFIYQISRCHIENSWQSHVRNSQQCIPMKKGILMSGCWRCMRGLAWRQKSKNPSFQIESLDAGQEDGFLMIFGCPSFIFIIFFWFLERVFGFLVVENPKTLKEKDWF